MSLFKCREWWSTKAVDQEGDSGCFCTGNVENYSTQDDTKSGEKIVFGTLTGFLRIYHPRKRRFQADDLLLEVQLGAPILQVELGRFIPNTNLFGIAVLHSRKLVVYSVTSVSSTGNEGSYYNLEKKYEHYLRHAAYNFTFGPFGGIEDRDFICVQAIDGTLSFFEQDQASFKTFLQTFLVPGPFIYFRKLDCFLTGNSQMELECYKYQNLASSASDSKEKSQDPSKKKLQTDWTVNLGEQALDIDVARCTRDYKPNQQDIIVLGERTLFFIDESGSIKNQKLLDYHPGCLTTYTLVEDTNEPVANLIIGSFNSSIKIYKENQLIWAAGLNSDPISLKVSKFGETAGLIVCLDELGYLSVNYLGTEPPANVVGVQPESKEVNYEDMDEELRILQEIIKEATNNTKPEPLNRVTLKIQEFEKIEYSLEEYSFSSLTTKILISYNGKEVIENITLSFETPTSIFTESNSIVIPTLVSSETPFSLPITFQCLTGAFPNSLDLKVALAYVNKKSEPRVAQASTTLPLHAVCKVVSPIKNSNFKLIIDTNKGAVNLTSLFEDVISSSRASISTSNVLSFRFCSGHDATIIVSKNAGRYRVQSETSFESMSLIIQELVRRLSNHFANGEDSDFKIAFKEDLPLQDYFKLVDTHFDLRVGLNETQKQLDQRAQQFRVIQKQLLSRYKNKNAAPIQNLDLLLEGTYQQLLDIAKQHENIEKALEMASNSLSCGTSLLLLLLRYKFNIDESNFAVLSNYLSPLVVESSDIGWEECTTASFDYLLRSSLAESTSIPQLIFPEDTSRFKKLLVSICEKLSKGAILVENSEAKKKKKKTKS